MASAAVETTKPVGSNPYRMMWFKAPPAVYFGWGGTEEALKDLAEARIQRVFIISDRNVVNKGYSKIVVDRLDELEIDYEIYADVSHASSTIVSQVIVPMQVFRPDCIVAIGGGTVMDVAKICRIIYDPSNPHTQLSDLYAYDHMQLLSDREDKTGVSRLPPADKHIRKLVCIPTTSGSGSEMTPVAWVEKDNEGTEYNLRPIISWRMTPDMTITDGFFTIGLPKDVVASAGFKAFGQAVESAVSKLSNDYTLALSVRAAKLFYEFLPTSAAEKHDQNSRARCHNAASIAGMAAGNAFTGIGHALAVVLHSFLQGQKVEASLGECMAIVLPKVVEFNCSSPDAAKKYAHMADQLGCLDSSKYTSMSVEDARANKAKDFAKAITDFRTKLGLKGSLSDFGIKKDVVDHHTDILAVETLRVVGCVALNPCEVSKEAVKKMIESCA